MKIFIVEDEMIVAMSLQLKLAEYGYNDTTLFPSGEKAVNNLAAAPPDLLIMDINLLGELDGLETVRRIRRHTNVPVIFLSGYSDASIRQEAAALSPLGFFIKPVDIEEIHRLIQREFG